MKYVLMFCDTPALYDEVDPADAKATYQEVFDWFGEHHAAGRIADGGAELQPVTTATTVKSGGDGPVVVDGPFSEAKEVVGGFTVVDVPDLDAALAMARTWPPLKYPGVSVEVRPSVDHSGDM
ncbi:MAG: hypothetical protein HOQ45_18975 [Nocardioidaceae bacterium]|nr:hypothetical protein [Nocardioidaceae bacterium]